MSDKIMMVTDHHVDSGIGYYSYELTRAMRTYFDASLIKPFRNNHSDCYLHEQHEWIHPARYKSFRNLRPYILPLFLRTAMQHQPKPALYHAHWIYAGLATTYLSKTPQIITMHDVSLLHVSDSIDRYLNYYKWGLERFKKMRIPLIVVSEQARQDTIEYARYPAELVYAVHNGINFDRFYPSQVSKEKDKFTLLYCGGLGKRKNVDLLLKAYQRLQDRYDFIQLIVAGSHPFNTPYPAMADDLGLRDVHFRGFIPDDQMNAFYNSGDLMVYTSDYEGFGMAPLEAMACNVPVISVKGGALQEVSGGGAHMVDYSVDEITDAIEKVVENSRYRKELAEKGHRWVKQYTWEAAAYKTAEIYEAVADVTLERTPTSSPTMELNT